MNFSLETYASAVYGRSAARIEAMVGGHRRRSAGNQPLPATTYRHGGHSRADPGKYRPAEEVAAWPDRDPITLYHQRPLRLEVSEGDLARISQDVARRVEEPTEFAKNGPLPEPESMMADVWADGGSAWRN